MKSIGRMVLVLALVCAVAATGLALVYAKTKGPIAEAQRREMLAAIAKVLPAYDNAPDTDKVTIDGVDYFPGRTGAEPVGAAFKVSTMDGYSGIMIAMVGVDPQGKVTGVRILTQTETPGLGAKIADPELLAQYEGHSLESANWQVKKDGGDFDQITGATITPRALVAAIAKGLEAYGAATDEIYAPKAAAPATEESEVQTAPVEGGAQ